MPKLSTNGAVRADYFGRGANNTSFFSIPINVPGGTGPNQGYFGTLGVTPSADLATPISTSR